MALGVGTHTHMHTHTHTHTHTHKHTHAHMTKNLHESGSKKPGPCMPASMLSFKKSHEGGHWLYTLGWLSLALTKFIAILHLLVFSAIKI